MFFHWKYLYIRRAVSDLPGIKHKKLNNMMKSRISVEIDFDDQNKPYIQILHPADTEDVRDSLLRNFLHTLGHVSSWLKIRWSDRHRDGEARIIITPISPEQLKEEATIMSEQVGVNANFFTPEKADRRTRIDDNSTGFRALLDSKGIKWEPSENHTIIIGDIDLFHLGMIVAKLKAASV